ncbi:MAG: hypothetical protein ACREEV_13230 [Dongiaceae bacterium]
MPRKRAAPAADSDDAVQPVPEFAHAAAEALEHALTGAELSGRRALRGLSDVVQERPLTSLAAAFCAGILLNRLFSRPRR